MKRAAVVVECRVAADVYKGLGVVQDKVLTGAEAQFLRADIGIGVDAAVFGSQFDLAALVQQAARDVDIGRGHAQAGCILDVVSRVAQVLHHYAWCCRVFRHGHVAEGRVATARFIGGLNAGIARHLGAVEEQLAAQVIRDFQPLEAKECLAVVDDFDLRIARCIELATADQGIALHQNIAGLGQYRINFQQPDFQAFRQGPLAGNSTGVIGDRTAHLLIQLAQGFVQQGTLSFKSRPFNRRNTVAG